MRSDVRLPVRIAARAVVVAGLAAGAAACGAGGDTGAPGATGEPTGAGPPTATEPAASPAATAPVQLDGEVDDRGTTTLSGDALELAAGNYYFEPTFVQAEPGTTVTVEVVNEGSLPHTFTVDAESVDVELDPDQRESVEVTVPDSGQLVFYCRFHRRQGMQGAFFTG